MFGKTGNGHRKVLVLIFALSAAPFVLATLMYVFWKPQPQSVGVLLQPIKTLPSAQTKTITGQNAAFPKGKWLLLMATQAPCQANCQKTLFRSHQVRLAQGPGMLRLERVWLSNQTQDAAYAAAINAGVSVHLDESSALIGALPLGAGPVETAIYLLDPNLNVVMRYDASVDPVKMIREITKIMKINNGLG